MTRAPSRFSPARREDNVLLALDTGVFRQAAAHNAVQHEHDERCRKQKHQRDLPVDGKGHHNGADGKERRADGQADKHVHPVCT